MAPSLPPARREDLLIILHLFLARAGDDVYDIIVSRGGGQLLGDVVKLAQDEPVPVEDMAFTLFALVERHRLASVA